MTPGAATDIQFDIRPSGSGHGWETVSSGRAYTWAESAGTAARALVDALSGPRPPEAIDDRVRRLLEEDPSGLDGRAHQPRALGFIGKQLLPHLRRTLAAPGDSISCNLIVFRAADFRFVRLAHPGFSPPPLAYIGEWSHNSAYCAEVDLLALWCVLKADEHRSGLLAWFRGESACVLELPPFYNLRIDVELAVSRIENRYIVHGKLAAARLPNLGWMSETGTRLVRHLPSLFSIWHNDAERIEGVRGQLLIASPHLRSAASQGSSLWRDASVRSALLIAPPGSGKEVLADFLHTGRVVFRRKTKDPRLQAPDIAEKDYTLPTIQLAGYGSKEAWQRDLYGTLLQPPGDGEEPNKELPQEVQVEDLVWRNGLLRRARGTTVFFDEIDKAGEGFLKALLRFLENDDVAPYGGPAFPLGKGDGEEARGFKCLRLFAGSAPRNEMFALRPSDFWTRIQLVVDIVHPLEIHGRGERLRCLQEYVLMFILRGVDPNEAIAPADDKKSLTQVLAAVNDAREPDPDDLRKIAPLASRMDYPFLYLNADYARELTRHVAEFLVWIPSARLSVRNLKALMKRLDVRIRDWVTYEFDPLDVEGSREQGVDPLIARLEVLSRKLDAPGTVKAELDRTIEELRTRRQERHRNRDWIWAHLHHLALEVFDA